MSRLMFNYDEATRKRQALDGSHKSGRLVECFRTKREAHRNSALLCWMPCLAEFCIQDNEEEKPVTRKHQVLERPFASVDWSLLGSACPRDLLCWEYG